MALESYKGRQGFVYFPDQATLEQFKQRAKDAHKSLSSFIIETVEDYQRLQTENEPKPGLRKQIMELRRENEQLREELHTKSLAIKHLESKTTNLSTKRSEYYWGKHDDDGIPILDEPYYFLTEREAEAYDLFRKYQGKQLQEALKTVAYEDLLHLEVWKMIEEDPVHGWRLKPYVRERRKKKE